MIFDTHCHLNFSAFKRDAASIVQSNLNNEVWMVVVGTNKKTSERAVELSKLSEKGIYATVGLHPVHVTKQVISEGGVEFSTSGEKFKPHVYRHLIKKAKSHKKFLSFLRRKTYPGKVVAIGETGLDYQYGTTKKIKSLQKKVFLEHIYIADLLHLPLIIHARGSDDEFNHVYDDLINILEKERMRLKSGLHGIVHSFQGSLEQAQQLVNMGLLIGVNTMLKHNKELMAVVRNIQTKYIVLETDAPYFHPSGDTNKRNEPKNVQILAEIIAQLHNKTIYEIEAQTTQNVLHLFNIMG